MWPLTAEVPKPLLPLAGIPFLELQLRQIAAAGVEEAVLAVGEHDLAAFEEFAARRTDAPEIRFVVERERLDTAGPVVAALDMLDERFLVLNGDVIVETDLGAYLQQVPEDAAGALALVRVEDTSAYGVVVTDDAGTVERFVEKPPRDEAPADTVNAGIYVMTRAAFEGYDPGPLSFERVVFPALAARGDLAGIVVEGRWIDIGTPDNYLDATAAVLRGESRLHHPEPAVHLADDGPWAWVGRKAWVEEGATVTRSVLLPGARVVRGATVEDAIVGWEGVVGEDAVVRGHSMIGPRATIGSGCEIDHGARIAPDAVLPHGSITFTAPE
jgi:mannose-1-phosphate guanylyltransferase